MASEGESRDWSVIAVAVGTRVTQERERRKMTKEALGELSGLASRYIWRVEAGKQNVQLHTVSKIAAGLELTLAELLDGVEELVRNPMPKAPVRPRGPAARARS